MMYHKIMEIKVDLRSNGILYMQLWHSRHGVYEPALRCAIPWGFMQFNFFTIHGKMEYRGLS